MNYTSNWWASNGEYAQFTAEDLELINDVKNSKPPKLPRYFARKYELRRAIDIFKDADVYVVDHKNNYWFHGKRVDPPEPDFKKEAPSL